MTAAPTLAMHAAARGDGYHIPFGGMSGYQHADDVAKLFIRAAEFPMMAQACSTSKGKSHICTTSFRRLKTLCQR